MTCPVLPPKWSPCYVEEFASGFLITFIKKNNRAYCADARLPQLSVIFCSSVWSSKLYITNVHKYTDKTEQYKPFWHDNLCIKILFVMLYQKAGAKVDISKTLHNKNLDTDTCIRTSFAFLKRYIKEGRNVINIRFCTVHTGINFRKYSSLPILRKSEYSRENRWNSKGTHQENTSLLKIKIQWNIGTAKEE